MTGDNRVSGFGSIELTEVQVSRAVGAENQASDQVLTLTSLENPYQVDRTPEDLVALARERDQLLINHSKMAVSHKIMKTFGGLLQGFTGIIGALFLAVGAVLNVVLRITYALLMVGGGAAGGLAGVGVGLTLALTAGVIKGIYERVTDKTEKIKLHEQIWVNMKEFIQQGPMIGAALGATICADLALFIPAKISETFVECGTAMMESPGWLDKGKSRAIIDWVGQVPETPMRDQLWVFLTH